MDELDPTSPLNQKLDYLIRAVDEQQKMITALHKQMIFGRVVKGIYWFVIIGIAIGAFYFIQPALENLVGVYGNLNQTANDINDVFMPR